MPDENVDEVIVVGTRSSGDAIICGMQCQALFDQFAENKGPEILAATLSVAATLGVGAVCTASGGFGCIAAFALSTADAARSVGQATLDKDWVMTLAEGLGASDVEAADIAKMVDYVSLTTSASGSYRAGLEYIAKNPKEGVQLVEFLTGAGSDIADFGNLYVHPTAVPATY